MNFGIFNNYMNAVMNAIDAQHNHLDEQAEITFTNNGKWALHKLEKIFKDNDQNIRRSPKDLYSRDLTFAQSQEQRRKGQVLRY